MSERLSHRDGSLELLVVVPGGPHVARRVGEAHRRVDDDGGGREALVERRGVDDGLERRAGLPVALRHAVELTLGKVDPAHPGEHVARPGLEREQRPLRFRRLVQLQRERLRDLLRRLPPTLRYPFLGPLDTHENDIAHRERIAYRGDVVRRAAGIGLARPGHVL